MRASWSSLLVSFRSNRLIKAVKRLAGAANFRYRHRNIERNFWSCFEIGREIKRSTSSSNDKPVSALELLSLLGFGRTTAPGLAGRLCPSSPSSSMFKKLLKESDPPLCRQAVCNRCWRLSWLGECSSCADGLRVFKRAPDGGVCGRTGCELLRA